MNYITEIITGLTGLAAAGGLGAVFNFKLKTKIKTLEKEQNNLVIQKINERIDLFEKIIENLNNMIADIIERMDKKDDREVLMIEIQSKANEIISIKELENSGLKHLIFNGVKEFNNFIKIVYASNFNTPIKELKDIAYNLLKLVKHQGDWTAFFENSLVLVQFLIKLENQVIMPLLENFIIEYSEIKFQNDKRRKLFADLSKNFVCEIVKQSIDLYKSFLS